MVSFIKNIFSGKSSPENLSTVLMAYNESRGTKNLSSLCYAPSTNMYFSQDGTVKLCCHNAEYVIGKYPDQSIKEIWNSDDAKKIRADMKKYLLAKGCSICKSDLDAGKYEEVRARHFDTLPIHNEFPTMMEFLMTNTCNLECSMCIGEFSSLIRQNREKLPPIPYVYDDSFLDQLREFIPYLHEARFSGSGEAFLIETNYKIWEMILELNPKCTIMIQTNGTVLNNRIKDLLNRGNFQIGVSIDSLKKEVFEKIRHHARFERVMENAKYFSDYCNQKKIKFSVALCVMRQNWKELPDFVRFANSLNATATFHKVYQPMEYSLQTLSKGELNKVIQFLSHSTFESTNSTQRQNKRHFEYILDSVKMWYAEASDIVVEHLTDEELIDHILTESISYFEEGPTGPNNHKAFESKFYELLEALGDDRKKRKILIQLYRSDFNQIYPYFGQYSVDDLLKLSSKLAPDQII